MNSSTFLLNSSTITENPCIILFFFFYCSLHPLSNKAPYLQVLQTSSINFMGLCKLPFHRKDIVVSEVDVGRLELVYYIKELFCFKGIYFMRLKNYMIIDSILHPMISKHSTKVNNEYGKRVTSLGSSWHLKFIGRILVLASCMLYTVQFYL